MEGGTPSLILLLLLLCWSLLYFFCLPDCCKIRCVTDDRNWKRRRCRCGGVVFRLPLSVSSKVRVDRDRAEDETTGGATAIASFPDTTTAANSSSTQEPLTIRRRRQRLFCFLAVCRASLLATRDTLLPRIILFVVVAIP